MIDDDIPIPPRRGRKPKYPFATMAVNQSFFAAVRVSTLQACARRATVAFPTRRFTTRARVENGVPGARCWRTE